MTKVHVIKDESLGGIEREYVEVYRRADVGDYIVIIDAYYTGNAYRNGDVLKVSELYESKGSVICEEIANSDNDNGQIDLCEYYVLEPTDIVHIENERYRLVDRKAEVGERILVKMDAEADEHNLGKVYEVIELDWEFVNTSGFYDDYSTLNLLQEEYYVLDPVVSENKPTSNAPQSTDDIIANLVRRVASLESELTDAKRDIETWAQEHEKTKKELDDKIEMCIDDIVTLDERTQTESLTKFTQRGSRI